MRWCPKPELTRRKAARKCANTFEDLQHRQGRFWPNLEEAVHKCAISASLVLAYASHVLRPRSWN